MVMRCEGGFCFRVGGRWNGMEWDSFLVVVGGELVRG